MPQLRVETDYTVAAFLGYGDTILNAAQTRPN